MFVLGGEGQFSLPVEVSITMPTPTGATVEGTISGSGEGGVQGIEMYLIAPDGRAVSDTDDDGVPDSDVLATTYTHLDGTYAFTSATTNTNGVPPSNVGAYVCADAVGSATGRHAAGFASQCAAGAAWDTDPERPTGTTVPLVAGHIDTVDLTLALGGGITGTMATSPQHGAGNAEVDVYSLTTHELTYAETAADGRWLVSGLTPGTYAVGFGGEGSKTAVTGYAPQCYRGAVYGSAAHATSVQVTAGAMTNGIDDTVGLGGAVKGVVDDATTGEALEDVDVYVFDAGHLVGFTSTYANGLYLITGLPTGQALTVCVDGEYSTLNGSDPGHEAQCYQSTPWDVEDVPVAGTAVTLTPAETRFINFQLALTGGVTGTVTKTNGFGVGNVGVAVFSSRTTAPGSRWSGTVSPTPPATTSSAGCRPAATASASTRAAPARRRWAIPVTCRSATAGRRGTVARRPVIP